jgi:hypothetical protein
VKHERETGRSDVAWTCDLFERWLDDGEPTSAATAAHAHAATCARCAASLADLHAFESWVSAPTPAPAGLTDQVMRRVAAAERARAALGDDSLVEPLGDPLPWWVRVASQPSVVLAAALAALVAGFGPLIVSGATSLAVQLASAWSTVEMPALAQGRGALGVFSDPWVQIGLAWGVLPAIALLSFGLLRWTEQRIATAFGPRPRRGRVSSPTIH